MFRLANCAARTTKEIFDTYTTEHDGGFGFDKTIIPISLAFQGDDMLVSRSQAKRLLNRFERFKVVVLDFEGVQEVGQAFADEIFRVFSNFHPATEIRALNANEQVQKMIASTLSSLILWIQSLEFDASIFCSKLPIGTLAGSISRLLPRLHLASKRFNVSNPSIQTLLRQDTKLNLRHIEPTAMLRRVMNLQSLHIRPRLLRRKTLIQRTYLVNVQIVHH